MVHASASPSNKIRLCAGVTAASMDSSQRAAGNGDVANPDRGPSSAIIQAPSAVAGKKRKVRFDEQPAKIARHADQLSPSNRVSSIADQPNASKLPNGAPTSPSCTDTVHATQSHPNGWFPQPNGTLHTAGLHHDQPSSSHGSLPNGTTSSHAEQHAASIAARQEANVDASSTGIAAEQPAANGKSKKAADKEEAKKTEQVILYPSLFVVCMHLG